MAKLLSIDLAYKKLVICTLFDIHEGTLDWVSGYNPNTFLEDLQKLFKSLLKRDHNQRYSDIPQGEIAAPGSSEGVFCPISHVVIEENAGRLNWNVRSKLDYLTGQIRQIVAQFEQVEFHTVKPIEWQQAYCKAKGLKKSAKRKFLIAIAKEMFPGCFAQEHYDWDVTAALLMGDYILRRIKKTRELEK